MKQHTTRDRVRRSTRLGTELQFSLLLETAKTLIEHASPAWAPSTHALCRSVDVLALKSVIEQIEKGKVS